MSNTFKHKGFIIEFVETERRYKYTRTGYWTARRSSNGKVVLRGKDLGPILKAIKVEEKLAVIRSARN